MKDECRGRFRCVTMYSEQQSPQLEKETIESTQAAAACIACHANLSLYCSERTFLIQKTPLSWLVQVVSIMARNLTVAVLLKSPYHSNFRPANQQATAFPGTALPNCSFLASHIQEYQEKGEIRTISIGGADGVIGFVSKSLARGVCRYDLGAF